MNTDGQFDGDFISAKSVKDGDLLEILNEGKMEWSDALKKDCFNLSVKLNGERVKTWSPNNKHGKILQQAFGNDSANWVGKKLQLLLIEGQLLIKPLTEKIA